MDGYGDWELAVVYEDGDGDWMLVGDVPWEYAPSLKLQCHYIIWTIGVEMVLGSNKWQMHVSGLQDVRVLVQEDEGDAIVRGERVELQRLTGMPRLTALRAE